MQTNTNEEIIPTEQETQKEEIKTTEQDTHIPLLEESNKNKKALLTPIIVLLVLLLMGATAYATNYFISLNNSEENLENEKLLTDQEAEEGQKIEIEEEKETVTTYSEYLGKYIKAEIPDGWTIVEYENGEGTNMLGNGAEYRGLTGMTILNDLREEMFSLQAADGLGGFYLCIPEAQFPDTPDTYIEELISEAENFEKERAEDNDYDYKPELHAVPKIAEEEFTDFNFFEYRGRRIDSNLYWNDLKNINFNEFHTSCPFPTPNGVVLDLENLSFYHQDNSTDRLSSYELKISETTNEETRLILDYVLSSFDVKE